MLEHYLVIKQKKRSRLGSVQLNAVQKERCKAAIAKPEIVRAVMSGWSQSDLDHRLLAR